jgi:hypothetical protein
LLKKMLPILAMLVAGYMAKQRSGAAAARPASGGLGGILGSLMGGQSGTATAAPGAGISGLASMLDLNGDGNPLDDIMRLTGGRPH